jgi:hypothetical protein
MTRDHSATLLRKLRALSCVDTKITPETEVFYDLRIYGGDMDDLFMWITNEYGIKFSNMRGRYAPGDADLFPFLFRLFKTRPYKSLTVQKLLDTIASRAWVE